MTPVYQDSLIAETIPPLEYAADSIRRDAIELRELFEDAPFRHRQAALDNIEAALEELKAIVRFI
jgi:hypothetical protein